MGIDLDKMRQKHSALTTRGATPRTTFGSQKKAHTSYDLCVLPTAILSLRRTTTTAWEPRAKQLSSVLAPMATPTPSQNGEQRLWNEGTEGSKEAAKRFWPKMRIFAPVVVRGEEDKGVRWWGFSRTTYQALLDVVLDPDYGDITDTEKGTDLRIDYGKKSGQQFPTTDVRPMRRTSKLAKTEEEVNTLLESIKVADDIFEVATYEECEKVLNDTLGDTDTTTGSETTRYNEDTTTTKPNINLEGVSDIETAFDESAGVVDRHPQGGTGLQVSLHYGE